MLVPGSSADCQGIVTFRRKSAGNLTQPRSCSIRSAESSHFPLHFYRGKVYLCSVEVKGERFERRTT